MPVSRARHLSAVVTACAALLLCAGAAQTADDDFYIYPGGVRGPAPTGDRGSSGGLEVGRPGHDSPSHTDPYGYRNDLGSARAYVDRDDQGFYSRAYMDPDDQGFYPRAYLEPDDDLGFYGSSYLNRNDGRRPRGRASSDVQRRLHPVAARSPYHRSSTYARRRFASHGFDPFFSLETELALVYEASGWTPLADGRTDHALRLFTELARRRPERGAPRVGLAIATAELGDRDRGVDLMREALRVEGDAIHDVRVDDRLRVRLAALGRHYPATEFSKDAHFMRAALCYLGAKNDAAHTAIERALARGDDSESAATLRRLIVEHPRSSHAALSPAAESR